QGVGFALQLGVDAAGEVGHTVAPFADARARRPAGTCRPASGCPSHTAPSRGTVRDGAACGATRTNARGAQAERRRPARRRLAWRPPARRPPPRNAGLRASWTQPPQFAADASTVKGAIMPSARCGRPVSGSGMTQMTAYSPGTRSYVQ